MQSCRWSSVALSILAAVLVQVGPVAADQWPQWRGPERTGVGAGEAPPVRWSATENVVWKLTLPGTSGATPIVWNDRVFLNVAEGRSLSLWAVDRENGKVAWKRKLDDRNEHKRKGNLSSPSPITDGEAIWVMTGTGVLTAFDFAGERLWERRLQQEYGEFGILHGYSSSPLLHGDRLYVQVLHGFHTDDPSYVLALDQDNGETVWRVERPTDAPREAPDAYTTPALLESGGSASLVVSGADYVTGHDLATGRELWRVPGLNPTRNPMQRVVASPVVAGEMIFAPSRVNPLLALDASAGAGRTPALAWSMDRGPDVPTPVADGEHLYLLNDKGILWNLRARTGEVVWGPERIRPAIYSASPVVAAGHLYATSEDGVTTVARLSPEFEVVAENDVGEYTLASLAISRGQIFLRTSDHLYCIADTASADHQDRTGEPVQQGH